MLSANLDKQMNHKPNFDYTNPSNEHKVPTPGIKAQSLYYKTKKGVDEILSPQISNQSIHATNHFKDKSLW